MRLCELAGAAVVTIQAKKSAHRKLLETLGNTTGTRSYCELLDMTLTLEGKFSDGEWVQALPLILDVVAQMTGTRSLNEEASKFLVRSNVLPGDGARDDGIPAALNNVYSYPTQKPKVHIRLGSIHSVKGETHTATLVLDSFFHQHHLSELKPWLLGERTGGMKKKLRGKPEFEGSRMLGRLKLHYVAMTRPSHLLCLAMRRDAFIDSELEILTERGWTMVQC